MRLIAVVLLTVLVAGCGGDNGDMPEESSREPAGDLYACGQRSSTCQMFGAAFTESKTLTEVEAFASNANIDLIALWRQTPVCVSAPVGPPGGRKHDILSSFAYYNADEVVQHQNSASGPPITDGGYSFAKRDEFREGWRNAKNPGVMFSGAAFYAPPHSITPVGAISATAPLEYHVTDTGRVIYLREHDQAMAQLFDVTTRNC